MTNHNKKTYTTILTLVKLMVIMGIVIFVYFKLKDEQNLNEAFISATHKAIQKEWPTLIFVILLMPLNWLLEAKKWTILTSPVQKLSIKEAFKGVLAGLSIGFITPHGIGAYIGRVLILENKERGKLVGAILLGRILQLFATLLFGSLGIFYLFGIRIWSLYIVLLACLLITGAVLVNLKMRVTFKWAKKAFYYIEIIKEYSLSLITKVTLVAFLRYFVFALQFILILGMFSTSHYLLNAAGTSWILFAKSVIPTFNFMSDLGVREFSAIYFFERYSVPLIPVVSASLLVWVINILVPTIVGAPLVMKLKLSR